MSDFTKEIVILDGIIKKATDAKVALEAAKEHEPLVAEIAKLREDRKGEEQRLEDAKQRAHAQKGEINQQLVAFRKQSDDETTAIYADLKAKKEDVASKTIEINKQLAAAEDNYKRIIGEREAQLARINDQVAKAEALRDQLISIK